MHLFTMRARSTSRVVLSGYAARRIHAKQVCAANTVQGVAFPRLARRGFSFVKGLRVHEPQSPFFCPAELLNASQQGCAA